MSPFFFFTNLDTCKHVYHSNPRRGNRSDSVHFNCEVECISDKHDGSKSLKHLTSELQLNWGFMPDNNRIIADNLLITYSLLTANFPLSNLALSHNGCGILSEIIFLIARSISRFCHAIK
jgi:hypothetical protein